MTKTYRPHPAAALMPLMKGEDLAAFIDDIRKKGQAVPAIVHDGLLLDGRNRQEACRVLGIDLKVVPWNGAGGSPTGFVVAANIERRHLKPAQRAAIAIKLLPMFRKEAKQRQLEAARKPRTKGAPRAHLPKRKATAEAARATGAGSRSIEATLAIQKADPAMLAKLHAGEITIKQAERQIRMKRQVAEAKAYIPPAGQFPVIVADPPWKFDDELNGSMNRGLPYPTMTVDQICEMFGASGPPAAPDCILWLWTTKSHLLDGSAHRVLKAWGFEPRSMLTWVKSNLGLGRWLRNRCEFSILAIRGSPRVDLHEQADVLFQTGQRLEHSVKPTEFFALVESLCPAGPKLELFAREPRVGWVTSGSELTAPAPADEAATARADTSNNEPSTPGRADDSSFSQRGGPGTPRKPTAKERSEMLRRPGGIPLHELLGEPSPVSSSPPTINPSRAKALNEAANFIREHVEVVVVVDDDPPPADFLAPPQSSDDIPF